MPNFFQLYSQYVSGTEPPPNFHAWSAIGAVSALLGKKCQIPQGLFTVFPHLYIVLVGEPGTRKSTAMNVAKGLVRTVKEVPLAAESSSREALIDFMAEQKVPYSVNGKDISYWQAASFGTELEQFLGGQHINQAMVGFLTAIWDEPKFVEQTRKSGRVVVNNPYFTLLGCCTPGWVTDKLKNNVITDGFSRRVIFALEKESACLNPWPQKTPDKLNQFAMLANEARRIFDICGQFNLTKPALELYSEEYIKVMKEAGNYPTKIQSYFTSRHELLLKICMCLSAGINSHKIISTSIVQAGIQFLSQSERRLAAVFAGVGRNELKSLSDRVLDFIRKGGEAGQTKAQVASAFYSDVNKPELDEIWEMLAFTGQAIPQIARSAQGVPTLRATVLDPLPPAINLLDVVRQLEVHSGETMVENQAFEPEGHLDPETKQLLASEAERKAQLARGILLKGKSRSSGSAEESP